VSYRQLSASRADTLPTTRRAGVCRSRIGSIRWPGGGSDPLYPDDPSLAGNRRIAIVLLREDPVLPTDTSL
jgi:chemotaxis protein MotB